MRGFEICRCGPSEITMQTIFFADGGIRIITMDASGSVLWNRSQFSTGVSRMVVVDQI